MQRRRPASRPSAKHGDERGYILLTLIFFVAVLAISLATILPSVIQEAKRDRENELVHRGAQYTRAIRLYYKKNGRYPAKIEDLEDTNNYRYLRKVYKDPTARGENGGDADFKILRFGDPNIHLQTGAGAPGQGFQNSGPQGLASNNPNNPSGAAAGRFGQASSIPTPVAPVTTDDSGDPNQAANAPAKDAAGNPIAAAPADAAVGDGSNANGDKPASGTENQSFGGGAMVGVASLTNKESIREFNKKHHYNEWQFLYDPQSDRGGLPTGPWQPPTFLGQAGNGQPQNIGTPADQMSNPVGQPATDSGSGSGAPHEIRQ